MKPLAIALLTAGACAATTGIVMNVIAIINAENDGAARLTTLSSPILILGLVSVLGGGLLLTYTKQRRRHR